MIEISSVCISPHYSYGTALSQVWHKSTETCNPSVGRGRGAASHVNHRSLKAPLKTLEAQRREHENAANAIRRNEVKIASCFRLLRLCPQSPPSKLRYQTRPTGFNCKFEWRGRPGSQGQAHLDVRANPPSRNTFAYYCQRDRANADTRRLDTNLLFAIGSSRRFCVRRRLVVIPSKEVFPMRGNPNTHKVRRP